jgi:16S rRNA (adenine1518-N6/adenine1519-N6)-dimethyltransferase
MKLTEMKQLLAEHDIHLTKSLGQNFLHDANQLRRIVSAAELKECDRVLEIGPGLGPLTDLLVRQAGEVLAIEKDAKLVAVLEQRFEAAQDPILHLVHDDALDYLARQVCNWSGWKLVANLPFSVASPVLVELALSGRGASRAQEAPEGRVLDDARALESGPRGPLLMVVTLQLEVAKRLLAEPGTPDYGILTLLVRLEYQPRDWFKVPAGCFFPEPDVDSACVSLVRRAQPLLAPALQGTFVSVVKRSFSQRRKMMLKLLKQDWPERCLAEEFERLKLSPRIRAEEVSLQQFARLTQGLSGNWR